MTSTIAPLSTDVLRGFVTDDEDLDDMFKYEVYDDINNRRLDIQECELRENNTVPEPQRTYFENMSKQLEDMLSVAEKIWDEYEYRQYRTGQFCCALLISLKDKIDEYMNYILRNNMPSKFALQVSIYNDLRNYLKSELAYVALAPVNPVSHTRILYMKVNEVKEVFKMLFNFNLSIKSKLGDLFNFIAATKGSGKSSEELLQRVYTLITQGEVAAAAEAAAAAAAPSEAAWFRDMYRMCIAVVVDLQKNPVPRRDRANVLYSLVDDVLETYKRYNWDTVKRSRAYQVIAMQYPNTAPLHKFYIQALAREYTPDQQNAMKWWSYITDTLIRGIPYQTMNSAEVAHRDIVGINLCMLTEEHITYLINYVDKKCFTFMRSQGVVNNNKAKANRLTQVMKYGNDLVPLRPFNLREDIVKEYVLQLYKELGQEFASVELLGQEFTSSELLPYDRTQEIYGLPSYWYTTLDIQYCLSQVMHFLNNFTKSLRSCAVEIPPDAYQIMVHRKTRKDNPPKMGFRACTVLGDNNFLGGEWLGGTSRLWLLPGTMVIPAMLLYTFIQVKEMEMVVVDGRYDADADNTTVGPRGVNALCLRF